MASDELRGVRVVSFESRRCKEMAILIEKRGGTAISAPSMREVALPDKSIGEKFATHLLANHYDGLVLLSGGGTRKLLESASLAVPESKLVEKLRGLWLICRGPKPNQVLRELGLQATLIAPEPNTSSELIQVIDSELSISGKRLAIQEYGESNAALLTALGERGATCDSILVYEWQLPEDIAPLEAAVRALASKSAEAALFTSARQVVHAFGVAEKLGLGEALRLGLNGCVVVSIGPVTTRALNQAGVLPKTQPDHPKMGHMVSHLARNWHELAGVGG